jgi:hypothetical protein
LTFPSPCVSCNRLAQPSLNTLSRGLFSPPHILATGIMERFSRRADGVLEPPTAESTWSLAETRTHAGIVRVERYAFDLL